MKKGELVKTKIIEKTVELFASYGYFQTSFQMIADACELKQSNVIYHFKDKHSLFLSVLNYILQSNYNSVELAMKPQMDAYDRLLTHMKMNLNWAINCKEQAQVILLLYYFATFETAFEAIYQKVLINGRARIYELLLAGVREGLFEDDEIEKRSETLHDLLVSSILPFISRCEPSTRKMKKETIAKWEEYLRLIQVA